MASEKMTYELTLRTSATGKGAAETKAGLEGVDAAAKKVAISSAQVAASGGSVEQFLRNTASQAKPAEIAFYDLDARLARTANTAEALPASLAKVGAGTKNVGMIATQAGYQVQDFFVQVGSGQSTLTAFAQQAPQFLSIFGPGGAIAGAVVAIGAVAAGVFSKIGDGAAAAAKRAEDSAASWKTTAENLAATQDEMIDKATEAFNLEIQQQDARSQKWAATKQANNEYSNAALDNARKEIETRRTVNELLGKTIDKLKELRELQEVESGKTTENAQQSLDAENNKLSEAQKAKREADAAAEFAANQLAEQQQQLSQRRTELVAAREKRDALQKTAGQKVGWGAALSDGAGQLPWQSTDAAKDAQKQMANENVLGNVTQLEAKVNGLETKLESLEANATQAQVKAEAAATSLQDTQAATSTNIDRIESTLAADQNAEKAKHAAEQSELMATELKGMMDRVDTSQAQSSEMRKALSEAVDGLDATKPEEKALRDKILQTVNNSSSSLAELQGLQGDIEKAAAAVDTSKAAGRLAQQRLAEVAKDLDDHTSQAEAVKQSIQKAVEDGKITVKEQEQLGKDLSTMLGLIQSHQVEVNGNITQLVAMFRSFQAENANLRKSIEILLNPQ